MSGPPILSASETIAASLCWLARMKRPGKEVAPAAVDQVEGYWHREACRFCSVDRAELMAKITATRADERWPDMEKAFQRLERNARAARVREAQMEPWYGQQDNQWYDAVTKEQT